MNRCVYAYNQKSAIPMSGSMTRAKTLLSGLQNESAPPAIGHVRPSRVPHVRLEPIWRPDSDGIFDWVSVCA